MTDRKARVLRITGVPPQMASSAIDTLLTGHRGVIAIDMVVSAPDESHGEAVHVVVEEAQAQRIRHKLSIAFAAAAVEDVTDTDAAGRAPAARVRAAAAPAAPPGLSLEPPRAKPTH